MMPYIIHLLPYYRVPFLVDKKGIGGRSPVSQDTATRKQAAIDIDDETDGPQTKKQRFTFKHEIPSEEQTTCCIKNCSQKAILTWESNLKPGFYRNLCEECLVDEFSGLPDGVDSIKTSADSNGGDNTQVDQLVVSSAPLRAAASKKKAALKKKTTPKRNICCL